MLKVENLTKIYSKGNREVTALDNVSFTLDDTGFVFITGKSGCGKSTLLNMLGGLDNATSGNIICDGNNLQEFSLTDFDNYRNTYLGFVFQDYCLIDDLNVEQNIEIALNLKGNESNIEEKTRLVDDALISVDLDPNIKNRFVKELSGGQKQRIAIARALIKNPRLILADEPTGNLDSRTSTKILKLLKKLSQDRLVVIVSHNLDDAKTYADRIIELSDGEIVSDITRKPEHKTNMSLNKGVLTLPLNGNLTTAQLKDINNNLQNNKIKKIYQAKSGFSKTRQHANTESKQVSIEPRKMQFSSSVGLARLFLKKRIFASIVTISVITLLVFVLGLCQFFIQFQESSTVIDVLQKHGESDVLIHKGYYNDDEVLETGKFIQISDNEINEFRDSGYSGNIYQLLYDPFCYASYETESGQSIGIWKYLRELYITQSLGTLVCDEEYLTSRFGVNGQLNIIDGSLGDKPYGIIITDYMADSIKALTDDKTIPKNALCGKVVANRQYINAIIDTNYEEEFADLFNYYKDLASGKDRSADKDYFKTRATEFMSAVQKYYGIAYTINPNYQTDVKDAPITESRLNYYTISGNGFSQYLDSTHLTRVSTIPDNEVWIEYDCFNTMFGKQLGIYNEENYESFTPITLTISKLDGTEEDNVVYSTEITISKLVSPDTLPWSQKGHRVMLVSGNLFSLFKANYRYTYALYFDDSSQLAPIYDTINSGPYSVQSRLYNSISTVGDIVVIFEDLFGLILLGIGGVSMILLVSYAYGNIKKRYYEIGVLKALGATTKNVGFIFSLQTLLAGTIISIVSTIMLLTLCTPINMTISSRLLEFVNDESIGIVKVLQIHLPTIIANILIILFVTIMSCIIPILRLNKIKPKNIIANKD